MHSIHSTNKGLVAYVPAIHAGYVALLKKHTDADVFVLGTHFIEAFPRLNRDLRALEPQQAANALQTLNIAPHVHVLNESDVAKLAVYEEIIAPDEDVTRDFAQQYLANKHVTFENIFLRWNGQIMNFEKEPPPDRIISTSDLDRELIGNAKLEGEKSADWWRQIGSILVKDGRVILAGHIRYFPSDLALDILGTPRICVDAGERPDLYISMHAEADIIAQAAHAGISLQGASLYVSTFPCINCAFLVARSGIAKLYYSQGYAKLDADDVLRSAGVEVILVK